MRSLLKQTKFEYKIPIIYLLLGASWILFSDTLVDQIGLSKELLVKVNVSKGFFYVLITTVLLYYLLKIHQRKNLVAENIIKQRNELLEAQNSELKNLKQKAEESELQFRLLVDNAPEAILIQVDWKFVYVNKAAIKLYGAKNEQELIGKMVFDRIHPDFREAVSEKIVQLNQKQMSVESSEYKHLRLDGIAIDVDVSAVPIKFENKSGALVFVRNISDRKQIEKDLNKSFNLLNNLARQVPGVIYQYQLFPDGRSAFPFSSPGMYNIYEVTSDEVREDASPVFTRIHPEDFNYIVETINESAKNQTEYHSEFRVILPKQGERWRLCNAKPELLEDGSTLWHGIIMDITDRKNAEELYKQKNEEVNTFFECAIDLLCISDTNGVFIRLNKEWENVLNYTLEELIGQEFIKFVHPDDIESTLNASNQLANQVEIYNFTNRYRCKDGSYKWIEWKAYPKGKFIYAAARDITERVNQKQELITAKEKAEESDRLKTAFLQNMSHEIRTPMNAIMGFSEFLVPSFHDKAKLEYFTNIITQRCNDLLVIIDDILDISKIESGQVKINADSCNLSSLFEELKAFFTELQKKQKKNHINFFLELNRDTENLIFLTDAIKLKQIFINLIGNAFKFTNDGLIECGCKFFNSDTLLFYVLDTGVGIPQEKQELIFERFVQINPSNSRLYGGTGLGLSIVKGLVNLLGGKIWLESEPDKGSVFYFTIPYKALPHIESQKKIIKEQANFGYFAENKTLLVVEDDTYNTAYLKEILSKTKLNVMYVQNGKEAIEVAREQNIDLILMDISLPDISGYDAIAQILKFKPTIKIVAQTAYSMPADKQKAINAGCIDYISKPLKANFLLDMVSKHLND